MASIRQLEEKVVASEIILMRWNDRMDLLALANVKGEVTLHRLTWNKVWCLLPDKEDNKVIDMVWRPDGKIIAVGYSTGKVVLVEVEKKNILREILIEDSISCIIWQQDKIGTVLCEPTKGNNSESVPVGNSSVFLPDLPSLSSDFPSTTNNPTENLVDLHFVKNQNNLNILIIGTQTGKLHISIFGLFACAVVDISNHLNEKCSILNANMSENHSTLFVTTCNQNNIIQIVVLNTSILSTHSKELFAMALKHGHLVSLLSYLESTMSSITEAWESILLEMDSKLSKYASRVPEGTVTADFLELLMFGIPTDEMEEFLMQDLTDKGLKKMGHSIELSYSNIQKLLLKHLHEVGQHITFHLTELRGMARFTFRDKNLGLNEKTITTALRSNGAFLMKCVEVQQVINNSLSNYRAFFRWLYVVILRFMGEQIPPEIPKMAQQDITDIVEFLQNFDSLGNNSEGQTGRFKLERLGQYLVDAPLVILPKNEANIWSEFLDENESIAENDYIIKYCESMSLIQQHKQLVSSVEKIFIEPNQFLSHNFKFLQSFSCLNISAADNLFMSQLNMNEYTTSFTFYDKHHSRDGVYLLEINTLEDFSLKGARLNSSYIPEYPVSNGCKILDTKFYSPTFLSFLLEEPSLNKHHYLCQTSIKSIRSNLTDLAKTDSLIFNQHVNKLDLCSISGNIVKQIDGMIALKFQVSSSRHVCVVLSENQRKVQLFEMEADDEEEEFDETFITANTSRDTEGMFQSSVSSD